MHLVGTEGSMDLSGAGEDDLVTLHLFLGDGQVVTPHDDVLGRSDDRIPVCRREDVVCRQHQVLRFQLSFYREWQVNSHLVAVKVSIEPLADEWVHENRIAFDENRLKSLDSHAVKGRRTVQQHRVPLSHLLEDIPDLIVFSFQHLLGTLDGICVSKFLEAADDEGLEQFQSDLLGETALMQFEFGTHCDD